MSIFRKMQRAQQSKNSVPSRQKALNTRIVSPEAMLMDIMAVAGRALSLAEMASALGHFGPRHLAESEMESLLRPALKQSWVRRLENGTYEQLPQRSHEALCQAVARKESLDPYLKALGPAWQDERTRLRISLYAGQVDAFRSIVGQLHDWRPQQREILLDLCFNPFRPDWFVRLEVPIRSLAFEEKVRTKGWLLLQAHPEIEESFDRFEESGMIGGDEITARGETLLWRHGPQALQPLIQKYPRQARFFKGWQLCLEGKAAEALPIFESAPADRALQGLSEYFYRLCLWRLDPAEAERLLHTQRVHPLHSHMRGLAWYRQAQIHPEDPKLVADVEVALGWAQAPPICAHFLHGLHVWWSFPEKLPQLQIRLRECIVKARQAGYSWMAGQIELLLGRAGLGEAGQGYGLADLLPSPDWQGPIARLKEWADQPVVNEPAVRWSWRFHPDGLTVHSQRRRSDGRLEPARGAVLEALVSRAPDEFSTAERAALSYYRPGQNSLDARALLCLAGLPNICCAQSGQLLQVREAPPQLRIETTERHWHIRLEPAPLRGKWGWQRREEEIGVTDYGPWQALCELVGDGLTIPLGAPGVLQEVLAALAQRIPISADLLNHLQLTEVVPDSRARILLRPYLGRYLAQMRVRPLGDETAHYLVGAGPGLAIGGGRRCQRDLAAEGQNAFQLLDSLTSLASTGWDWDLSLEECLSLVDELFDRPQAILEWPEGGEPEVSRGSASLRVSAHRLEDWFTLEGELQVDEGLVLTLRRLFELWGESPGRFLKLDEGQFLALSEALRKQLDEIFDLTANEELQVSPLAAACLDIAGDPEWESLRQRIRQAPAQAPAALPESLNAQLRPYQRQGYEWLAQMADMGMGACLADDMGLGKTLQTLTLLARRASLGPALVVAPTSVIPNWVDEATRFLPGLRCHQLPARDREQFVLNLVAQDVLVVSYALLRGCDLGVRHWATVVLDEAQNIKNSESLTARTAVKLSADFRLTTTGTPIENHAGELWSLFRFLNPGLFGGWKHFTRRFLQPIQSGDSGARDRLRRLIAPFLLRRTKSQVLPELPPRTEVDLRVEVGPEERALYEAMRRQALAELTQTKVNAAHLFTHLTRLRQACCHPGLVHPELDLPGAKLDAFLELVTDLRESGHRCLVFSQFLGMLERVRQALQERAISYLYLDGKSKGRKALIDSFQAGTGDVFLISTKAGGTGINLTGANYVIHLDPWWNPAVEDQASDRAHRIGQTRSVTVYRLITANTIEEKMVQLHRGKRELATALLSGLNIARKISAEDLLELLRDDELR